MLDDAFKRRLHEFRDDIDRRLPALLAGSRAPAVLRDAISYTLLSPGKRLRPTLTLLAAEHFGRADPDGARAAALDAGCAIEMVHAASLILDDLPCMDDAAVRRGRPTCHLRFGEDMAVLAAVALLNQAYATLAAAPGLPAATRLSLVAQLSAAVGLDGLVAGQARDLRERASVDDAAPLHDINRQKTGVLFVAAVEAGAAAAGATGARLDGARAFAAALGEAFQILDDLMDATATPAAAGKDVRQDGKKPTVVSLVGAEAARAEMRRKLDAALDHLGGHGARTPQPLRRSAVRHRAPSRRSAAYVNPSGSGRRRPDLPRRRSAG